MAQLALGHCTCSARGLRPVRERRRARLFCCARQAEAKTANTVEYKDSWSDIAFIALCRKVCFYLQLLLQQCGYLLSMLTGKRGAGVWQHRWVAVASALEGGQRDVCGHGGGLACSDEGALTVLRSAAHGAYLRSLCAVLQSLQPRVSLEQSPTKWAGVSPGASRSEHTWNARAAARGSPKSSQHTSAQAGTQQRPAAGQRCAQAALLGCCHVPATLACASRP